MLPYLIISFVIGAAVGAGYIYFMYEQSKPKGAPEEVKAAWIYVGPIGDLGWTYAHNYGREYVDNKFDWLTTAYKESVTAEDFSTVVESYISEGYNVIFATSFEFIDACAYLAEQYPDVLFFHCSGWDIYLTGSQPKNLGFYFAEFYQLYYLNGLMAGALTETGKVGYVAAHTIPEVVRHINAFAIGVFEAARYLNKSDVTVYVNEIGAWYDPTTARNLAQELVSGHGVDVIAFTEDSPAIVEFCQEQYDEGNPVYTFSHYSPMYDYGQDVTVSGQLVHWEKIYEDIITKVYTGVYNEDNLRDMVDYWWMLKEGAVELGADFGMPINPKFESILKNKKFAIDSKLEAELKAYDMEDVITTVDGEKQISIYDLVMLRLKQMMDDVPTFDPFTGPIYANDGTLKVPSGVRMSRYELWTIDWFVDGVVYLE